MDGAGGGPAALGSPLRAAALVAAARWPEGAPCSRCNSPATEVVGPQKDSPPVAVDLRCLACGATSSRQLDVGLDLGAARSSRALLRALHTQRGGPAGPRPTPGTNASDEDLTAAEVTLAARVVQLALAPFDFGQVEAELIGLELPTPVGDNPNGDPAAREGRPPRMCSRRVSLACAAALVLGSVAAWWQVVPERDSHAMEFDLPTLEEAGALDARGEAIRGGGVHDGRVWSATVPRRLGEPVEAWLERAREEFVRAREHAAEAE